MTRLINPLAGDPYAALGYGPSAPSPYAAPAGDGPPDPQAKDDESLLHRLGSPIISGLGYLGNVLDLPGSMVRDTLASISGKPTNPFDQLLHPFSHNERGLSTSGRQLLTQWGVAPNKETGIRGWFDDPMEAVRDLGGFGVDVGTDPLTYMLFGANQALGKGGKAMRAAGASKMNALKRMGTTVAETERQLTRLGKSSEVLDAINKLGYTNKAEFLAEHGAEAMGGLFKLHIPFTGLGSTVGRLGREAAHEVRGKDLLGTFDEAAEAMPKEIFKQTVAGHIATASDKLGRTVRYGDIPGTNFSPGQQIARLFQSKQGGIQGGKVGEFVGGKPYELGEAHRVNYRAQGAKAFTALKREGLVNDEGSSLLDQFMEETALVNEMDKATQAKYFKVSRIAAPLKVELERMLDKASTIGAPLTELADPTLIKYMPREAVDMLNRYSSGLGREEHLKAIWGGTNKLRKIISDPELLEGTHAEAVAKFYDKYGDDVMIRQGDQHTIETLVQHIREGYTPEQRQVGLFGRHRLEDIQDGLIAGHQKIEKVSVLNSAIAEYATPVGHIKGEEGVRVWDIWKEAGVEPGMPEPKLTPGERPGSAVRPSAESPATPRQGKTVDIEKTNVSLAGNKKEGALWDVSRKLKGKLAEYSIDPETVEGLNKLGNLEVPKSKAADLVRIVKGDDIKTAAGNVTRIFDMMQTAFKVGVLNMPARPMRDFVSGQIHAMITGNWSMDAFQKSWKLMRGEAVDFTYHPVIQRMMKEQGLEATAENSTEMMRQLAYTHQKFGAGGSHGAGEMMHQSDIARAEIAGLTGPTKGIKQPRSLYEIDKDIGEMWQVPREQWTAKMTAKRKSLLAEKNAVAGTTDAKFIPETLEPTPDAVPGLHTAEEVETYRAYKEQSRARTERLVAPPGPGEVDENELIRRLDPKRAAEADAIRQKMFADAVEYGRRNGYLDYVPTRSQDFYDKFVGHDPHDPLKPSTLAAGSSYNPFAVRGIGGALETKGYWPATFERINTFTDGMNRLQTFIHNFDRGASAARASQITDAIQVLYAPHSFSNFERGVLKRAFPFYSFTSRMTKHVIEELASKPGGGLAQVIRAQHEASATDLPMPAYVGQTGAIPFGTLADGTKRYITGLGLMHEDPVQLLGGGLGGAALELMSRTSPLPKALAELTTGESFFQRGQLGGGREIGEQDPPLGRLLTNLGLRSEVGGKATPVFGTPFEHLLANSPITRLISTARTLTDPRKRIPGTVLPGVSLLPALTGARITDVSEPAQDVAISQAADQLAKEHLDARRFETTYIPKDVREEAKLKNPKVAALIEDYNQIKSNLRKRSDLRKAREEKAKQAAKAMQAATSP